MKTGKILLLTLVHPDFLPPVYAVAQVLRDQGYSIHILTFNSYVTGGFDVGSNIELEALGAHNEATTLQRMQLRNKFIKRAKTLADGGPLAIISFCAFSFNCGLKIKNKIPLIYHALEISDFIFKDLFRSPLSSFRNLLALRNVRKADLVATPSIQRSAWLAGRCRLGFLPYTVLNTAYLQDAKNENSYEIFKQLVPPDFLTKKIVLYTGAINTETCIKELVLAFDLMNDDQTVLIINGVKDNMYCTELREIIGKTRSAGRIITLPYLSRDKVISLQSNAHIGVNLTREHENNVYSKMVAPNKTGEYTANNLYILGIMNEYLRPLNMKGIASLSDSAAPENISLALQHAIKTIAETGYKNKVKDFVENYFCMQQQLAPIISFIGRQEK